MQRAGSRLHTGGIMEMRAGMSCGLAQNGSRMIASEVLCRSVLATAKVSKSFLSHVNQVRQASLLLTLVEGKGSREIRGDCS